MVTPRVVCLALLGGLVLGVLHPEDSGARRVRVAISVSAPGEDWASSLADALVRSPRVASVGRVPGMPAPADLLDYAASRGFDFLVVATVSLPGADRSARVYSSIRGTRTGEILSEPGWESPVPDEFVRSQTFWLPVVAALEAAAEASAGTPPSSPEAPPPPSRWSLESGLYMGQFVDLWFGRGFLSDSLFLKVGLFQFLSGLFLGGEGLQSRSYPLMQPGLSLGGYFLPADRPLRPYAAATWCFRLSGDTFVPDPIAPYGLLAMVGAQWRLLDRAAAFFEAGIAVYPACDAYLLAVELSGGRAEDHGLYAVAYSDGVLVEYPQFRLGWRVNP